MKKIVVLLFFIFCTSCATMEPPIKSRAHDPVDLPEKMRPVAPEVDYEPIVDPATPKIDVKASELNLRLQEIIADSPIRSRGDVFADKPRDLDGTQQISFNFYDADLVEVIRVFMNLMEEDYIIHPDVSGRVSLSVNDNFNSEQLFDLLAGVLNMNNMAMINPNKIWEILPQANVPRHISSDKILFPDSSELPTRGQVIKGFRLKFIAASEMINILKPYLSQSAQVYAHESKGVLLVCDFPHSLERVSDLIALFDESVFADVKARVFPLQYINAVDAVEQLKNIAEQFGLDRSEISARSRISFLALERLNMVLAVTRNDHVLDFVEAWVDGLDRQLPETIVGRDRENIFVYYVQYGDADAIVESIRGVFDERIEKDERRLPSEVSGERPETAEISDPQAGVVLGELSGPVRFMIDQATNSIITRCYSVDYPQILSVIEKLDLYPKQVLIEVVIAEVRLSDRTKLGVDWKYILSLGGGVTGDIAFVPGEGALPASGLVFSVASSHRLQAALRAAVDDRNLQILSTPTILASDNKLARINIGDQVPFPTSTRRRIDETATAETIDTTIQYRDTGIILDVVPKINKDGMVRMEISQEVSSLSPERVEGITAPIINTRHTETTLAVDDQQTIVIAGLMRQERSMLRSGVPGINRVPVLRHLFGTTEDSFDNTELLIFITPHVILSREDSNYLTRNFLNRLDEVKAEMR